MKALNHIVDGSSPFTVFKSYVESYHAFIGIVKFGWGSCVIDPEFSLKKGMLEDLGIPCTPGGTLFEYFYLQNNIEKYLHFLRQNSFEWIEISRGTVEIPDSEYYDLVHRFSTEFYVMSEVGFKSAALSDQMTDLDWLQSCQLSIGAGAKLVILEARESGTAGVVGENGEVKTSMLNFLASNFDVESILFEAPVKSLQAHLINNFGSSVNLGNLSLQSILPVMALRNNLRAETLNFHS